MLIGIITAMFTPVHTKQIPPPSMEASWPSVSRGRAARSPLGILLKAWNEAGVLPLMVDSSPAAIGGTIDKTSANTILTILSFFTVYLLG
jgi:hypothetical protein